MARLVLAAIALGGLLSGAAAQSGQCNKVAANPCSLEGLSSSYTESVDTQSDARTISAAGCPNNNPFNVCIGDNPNPANTQNWEVSIPATPKLNSGDYSTSLANSLNLGLTGGIIGVTLNGIEIRSCYGAGAANYAECVDYDTSASKVEGDTFERCGGHGNPFHYHGAPVCLIQQMGPRSDNSSRQIGWAFDGFPIYGNRGPGGVYIQRCDTIGADPKYCADQCGGYYGEDYGDDFKYRYFMLGPDTDMTSDPLNLLPTAEFFPFSPKCFLGCGSMHATENSGDTSGDPQINRQMPACGSQASAGTIGGYTPTAMMGVTSQYSPQPVSVSPSPDAGPPLAVSAHRLVPLAGPPFFFVIYGW